MKMISSKSILTLVISAIFAFNIQAQVNAGGQPYMWESIEKRDLGICGKTFMSLDTEKLLAEDAEVPIR